MRALAARTASVQRAIRRSYSARGAWFAVHWDTKVIYAALC